MLYKKYFLKKQESVYETIILFLTMLDIRY